MSRARLSCVALLWLVAACGAYPNGNPFLRVVDDLAEADLKGEGADLATAKDLKDALKEDMATPQILWDEDFQGSSPPWTFNCGPGNTWDKKHSLVKTQNLGSPECSNAPDKLDNQCALFGVKFPDSGYCALNYNKFIDIPPGKRLRLTFKTSYSVSDARDAAMTTYTERLIIQFLGRTNTGALWSEQSEIFSRSSNGWEQMTRDFLFLNPDYTLQGVSFRFIVLSGAVMHDSFWRIDDVKLEVL